jgi:hypothetical protein
VKGKKTVRPPMKRVALAESPGEGEKTRTFT